MVHEITCQVFSEGACPSPNSFQRGLPRWFCVTNHLVCQVIGELEVHSYNKCWESKLNQGDGH